VKINVLPTEIANMIAAGEVVERPASVVKELVENCIDAGSTSITVEIKKGGVPYIRVTDNGCGIEPDEIETAFKRHATSKIKNASDLDAIGTLGFRGEALASIAAVARVEVFSKTSANQLGRCVTVEGGEVIDSDDAGCPDGTTMIVRNLFFNTPARMKFLKNDATETGYVTEIINKLVLSHPEVSFQYINNGKTVLSSNGDGKLLSSIYTVFGKDYAKNMTEVFYEEQGFKVTGYIGNSRLARKDRRHQLFFVNARNIMSRVMSAAVSEAYKNTVMTGHFPVCVLKAEVDPKTVDVNVHPAKIEVRFADEKQVYNMIYWAIKNALTDKKYIPEFEIKSSVGHKTAEGNMVKNAPSYESSEQINITFLKDADVKSGEPVNLQPAKKVEAVKDDVSPIVKPHNKMFFSSPSEVEDQTEKQKTEQENQKFARDEDLSRFSSKETVVPNVMQRKIFQDHSNTECKNVISQSVSEESKEKEIFKADVDFKLIGQVFGTFILVQKDNELLVIDQHAAHERLYFEELMEEFMTDVVQSQLMLLPVTITLSPTEFEVVMSNKSFFMQLGFEIDEFGQSSIIVRSTPGTLEEHDIKDCVNEIISLIMDNKNNIVRELYEEALHMIACKKALKGNKVLNDSEQKILAEKVLSLGDGINTCPHGRPIMIKMSKYSLEKQFKRIV